MTNGKTHFGFQEIDEADKPGMVQGLFGSVANKYDVMNDAMSFGIHRLWKDILIDRLSPRPDMQLLDIAGGTGDIATRFLKAGGGNVSICDLTVNMLTEGRNKFYDSGLLDLSENGGDTPLPIEWVQGDAEALPFASESQDACVIAFGLRNVTHIDRALADAWRVLKPGGHFLCLEFSHLSLNILQRLYDIYSFKYLPKIGHFIANDADSYRYLAESIRRFPNQSTLQKLMQQANFVNVSYQNLSQGIVAIHSGWKI